MTYIDYSIPSCVAAVICALPARAEELRQLAIQSGCRLCEPGEQADFLLVDLCSESDVAVADWAEIPRYLGDYETEALVWLEMDDVDAAYAALPTQRCHFFVESGDWQAVSILSGALRHVKAKTVRDKARDGELGALHRISSELADFARTLAQIAEQDKATGKSLRDKPVGFRPPPPDIFQPLLKTSGRNTRFDSRHIREIIKLRRLRDRLLGADLFADPGWDILLDLFAAQEEGREVSVSSLCIAASVPPTTALRWIGNMTETGHLIRRQDPHDARRVYIELSETMSAKLTAYFESLGDRAAMLI